MQQHPDILETLKDAQLAHNAGDFNNALNFYEYFFDHALDEDPYALYSVRLSHCLDGWAKLALEFPGAKARLEQKQNDVFQQYKETKSPEKFHDYYCISRSLRQKDVALDLFTKLFTDDPKTSEPLAKYVWDDLIQAENWEVCGKLLERPEQKIDECFALFDEGQKLKLADPLFDNQKFDQHLTDTLFNSISSIVHILRFNDRSTEINALERQFYQAIDNRSNTSLSKDVQSKASFLFLGH